MKAWAFYNCCLSASEGNLWHKNFNVLTFKFTGPKPLIFCEAFNNSLALGALILREIWNILRECRIFQNSARISAPRARELSCSPQNIRGCDYCREAIRFSYRASCDIRFCAQIPLLFFNCNTVKCLNICTEWNNKIFESLNPYMRHMVLMGH